MSTDRQAEAENEQIRQEYSRPSPKAALTTTHFCTGK
jgi:hypothetical protein